MTKSIASSGFSLLELLIAMTIMGILSSFGIPRFHRAMEQARVDLAGLELETIATAERLYWLDKHEYASLETLRDVGLLETRDLLRYEKGKHGFGYALKQTTKNRFLAMATRLDSGAWSGEFSIDDQADWQGGINGAGGAVLVPYSFSSTQHK